MKKTDRNIYRLPALDTVLKHTRDWGITTVPLVESLYHVLAEDITSDTDVPPFDKSAMDGFAIRKSDLGSPLEVIGTVQAGIFPAMTVGPGQCVRIMTGAAVPPGSDFVFKIEDSRELPDGKVVCTNPESARNICDRGEDVRKGDKLIHKGTRITARHLPVLAGAGYSSVSVAKFPVTGIIANGTELVEPGAQPRQGQIRNSNSYQLAGRLSELGLPYTYFGIVEDDPDSLTETLRKAIKNSDIVLVTGGASESDFDLVPDALMKLGFDIHLRKTGMKPGNPMTFATQDKKVCFGLSGNPVSSYVQFEVFVKPFIFRSMGMDFSENCRAYVIATEFHRKKADRYGLFPVVITSDNKIKPVEYHGSAHIHALSCADGLMEMVPGKYEIKKGELVYVRPL